MEAELCSRKLRWFAEHGCQGQSPLYEGLCSQAAEDSRLLEIARAAPQGQPAPNLFLAAVHYLLLSGAKHRLAEFYATCVPHPQPPHAAFAAFRDFCLTHEAALRELMAQGRVQTNEARCCAYLFPAFAYVAQRAPARPLALIDVGASAGLNLIWDHYAYDYGAGALWGSPHAQVRIAAELQGSRKPPLPQVFPAVAQRTGIDLHVPDLTKPHEALWLRSLLWPDQPQRMELLSAAIDELRSHPPRMREGDAFDLLPDLIRQAPGEAVVCVFHCHTLNQFSEQQRQAFGELLAAASRERPVVELSAEWIFTPAPELKLIHWEQGAGQGVHLANVDHHGRWIEWQAELD